LITFDQHPQFWCLHFAHLRSAVSLRQHWAALGRKSPTRERLGPRYCGNHYENGFLTWKTPGDLYVRGMSQQNKPEIPPALQGAVFPSDVSWLLCNPIRPVIYFE
jgi:hypothetical protein